jgi:hypothetical protein
MAKVTPDPLAPDVVPRARGRFLIQPYRGGVAARRWPRKRGSPTDPRPLYLQEQFGKAARMAANPEPMSLATAINHSKDTSWLPRDVLVRAAYGKLYTIVLPDGTVSRPASHAAPIPHVSTFMGALVTKSATQSLSGGVPTIVTWQTVVYDTGGFADLASQPTRLTVPAGVGFVRLTAGIALATPAGSGQQFLTALLNGAIGWIGRFTDARSSNQYFLAVSPVLQVAPGDFFEIRITTTTAEIIAVTDQTYYGLEGVG